MRLIAVLSALHFLAFIDRTLIGAVLPLLRASILMTDAQAGWIIGTAFALPYGVTAITVAAFLRRRQPSMGWLVAGVLLWTVGSLAMGIASSLNELTVARGMLGVGQGMFVPIAISTLFNSTDPAVRGRSLGLFIGSATAGRSSALLMAGLGLWLIAQLADGSRLEAWRWLFVATALPNFLVLIALGMRREQASERAVAMIDVAIDWRALLPVFFVAVAPVLLAQSVLAWLPTLFVRERSLVPTDAALMLGLVTLFAAPTGPFLAGWLASRYRSCEERMPILVLTALAATTVPLAGMIWAPGLATATASMAVMIITLGMATFSGLFAIQLMIPPNARVSVNGVYLAFVTMVGVGLGPLVTGALTSTATDGRSLGHALLVTAVIAVVACGLAVLATRGSQSRRQRS